ncbi:MAG: M6 family metalloprotease domain-containing protein [Candidatus Zixiibacteriota bacterium]
MKKLKYLYVVILLLVLVFSADADFLRDVPQTLVQPNGDTVNFFASGDEYYHWLHDANGFTIVRNPANHFLVYAQMKDNRLLATSLVVGRDDPSAAGLQPGLNIDQSTYERLRSQKQRPTNAANAPDSGKIYNLVVFIRFAGENSFGQDRSHFDSLFNIGVHTSFGLPNASVDEYYQKVSYNKLSVPTEEWHPDTTSSINASYLSTHVRDYFRPDSVAAGGYANKSERTQREQELVRDALESIKGEISSFWLGDFNNDGSIDNVSVIIKGSPDAWGDLLWSHESTMSVVSVSLPSIGQDKPVENYTFTFEDSKVGTLCHELFHSIGAPDMYRYSDTTIDPLGNWDLMSIQNKELPQHMGAYIKNKYASWASIPVINQSGTYSLLPLSDSTITIHGYKILSPTSFLGLEYFIVDYRNKTRGIYDNKLPGSGLLIHRINNSPFLSGNAQGPPDEDYLYRPGGIDATTNGQPNDACYSAEYGRLCINDLSTPAPFLSDNSDGGLFIADIGFPDSTISFYVGISPNERSGIVYDGIGGPLVPAGNPYWIVNDITVPLKWWLGMNNGTIAYFEPLTTITADGTFHVHSGSAWSMLQSIRRYRTGIKTKGDIKAYNGGGIRLY